MPKSWKSCYAEKARELLKQEVHNIYNHNSTRSFEEVYRSNCHMVLLRSGDQLYIAMIKALAYAIRQTSESIESAGDENFLEKFNNKWMQHNKALGFVHDILMYMERKFIKETQGTKTIHEIGFRRWIDSVIGSEKIRKRFPDKLVQLVLSERKGEVINTGLAGKIIKMLKDLGMPVYEKNFKKPFLLAFDDFYGSESRELINSVDCGNYLMEAEKRINEEWGRVSDYLDPSSESKIISVVVKQMIENHMHTLVHMEKSGLVNMLKEDNYKDLERMYNLFSKVPSGLKVVKDVMMSSIQDTGKQLIKDPKKLEKPEDFAQRLLALKDKYDNVITTVFNSDEIFQNVLNSSFEHFINFNAESVVYVENSDLVRMFIDDKYEDMKRYYNLFSKVPSGTVIVKDVMTSVIRETGKQLITDPEILKDPVGFVKRLLVLKDKYDKAITLAFNNDKKFQNALNSAFEYFINLSSRSPEFISLFVDDKLRRGLKGVGEEDVETVLDNVMMLFRYLQEKDTFQKYYKQHLAKRLLSGKTVSDEAEKSLIVKLKTECGYEFTSKLEGMFTDMKTSYDIMQGFLAGHGTELGDSPTLSVQVLTTGSWPIQSSPQCNLPSEILGVCEKFRSYYLGAHSGRRLSWQANMGNADLKATFGKGQKHELNVSTYQMCVLMLFNNADRLSCKEIEQATAIPMPDLKRCLQSLALVKGKNVLRKEPMSKDIAEDDAFFFNDKFTSKLFKVKIGTVVAQRGSEPENIETRERVEEDRKPQIDAAIIRVMKSRQILEYNNIIAEVTKLLHARFLPNPVVIKKRVESLIEREFLERDEVDRKIYRYLA